MVSYVTAFLLQERDRGNQAKIDSYLNRFKALSSLQINIIVFLDEQLDIEPQPNLHIIKTSLSDTQIWKEYAACQEEPVLPQIRSVEKDNADYMMIQNAKNEFIYLASKLDPFGSQHFVWIDFGILYVLKNPATSLVRLETLDAGSLPKGNLFAHINAGSHDQLFQRICWRFAGGCFIMNKENAERMYNAYLTAIREVKPALTWEVNIWAWLERQGRFDFDTYYGNHDDSMLVNLPQK